MPALQVAGAGLPGSPKRAGRELTSSHRPRDVDGSVGVCVMITAQLAAIMRRVDGRTGGVERLGGDGRRVVVSGRTSSKRERAGPPDRAHVGWTDADPAGRSSRLA